MKKTCEFLELLFLIDEEDENCDLFECPHNIFWRGLNLKCHETEISRRLKNCMLMVCEPIPTRKIGQMYGLPETKIKTLFLSERDSNQCVEVVRTAIRPPHSLRKGRSLHERNPYKRRQHLSCGR